jgi:hypothetical protein
MRKLPDMIDFNEAEHPSLTNIFREVDSAIATIIASDPAFRPKQVARRARSGNATKSAMVRTRGSRRVAA